MCDRHRLIKNHAAFAAQYAVQATGPLDLALAVIPRREDEQRRLDHEDATALAAHFSPLMAVG